MQIPNPRELGLPYDEWRPGQRTAIRTILHAKTPHVVINAPTGSGKSVIAAALPLLQPARRHVTLTATKSLMDQYNVFQLTDLRGAGNYTCRAAIDEFADWFPVRRRNTVKCDDGPCHVGVPCTLMQDGCDYYDARRAFIASNSGITNYAAWLANRKMGQGLGVADRLICDEAHAMPEQLMGACRIDIPYHLIDSAKVPRGHKEWARWATARLEVLAHTKDDDARVKRERIERGLRMMAGMDETWAWDVDEEGYHFEPTIPRLLLPLLQTLPEKDLDARSCVVYLSATVTPSMLSLLAVPPSEVTFHQLQNHFPLNNRPIYVLPGARVDYRSMKRPELVDRWVGAVTRFCEARDDRRGILHTVSFSRARLLYEMAPRELQRRMVLHVPRTPARVVLDQFYKAEQDTILVSPSMMTGVNFPYAAAEFQVITKLPFPDTRSNIMKARIRSTPRYRDHYTMTNLVQACGRIVRSDDDQGETAIVDEHFGWWYRNNRDLAPDWFDEAVVRTRRAIVPMQKL